MARRMGRRGSIPGGGSGSVLSITTSYTGGLAQAHADAATGGYDVIEMAAGTYSATSVSSMSGRTTSLVVRAAAGATVTVPSLTLSSSVGSVSYQGITFSGAVSVAGTSSVNLANGVTFSACTFDIPTGTDAVPKTGLTLGNVNNVSVTNCSIVGTTVCTGIGASGVCTNVTISGNYIKVGGDAGVILVGSSWDTVYVDGNEFDSITAAGTTHCDVLQTYNGPGQNLFFRKNEIHHSRGGILLADPASGGNPSCTNAVFEHNLFHHATGAQIAMQLKGVSGLKVVGNTLRDSSTSGGNRLGDAILFDVDQGTNCTNVVCFDNIAYAISDVSGTTYTTLSYNCVPNDNGGSGAGPSYRVSGTAMTNSITGATNPTFVDAANGDYRPASGSNVLAAGTASAGFYTPPTTDRGGRNFASPRAIGAYERVAGDP